MNKRLGLQLASTTLAMLLLLGTLLIVAVDTVSANQSGDYSYTVSNGGAIINADTGADGAVIIPSTLGGYPVEAIGNAAFFGCSALTSIIIPNSVTSIGTSAFEDCTSLSSVTLGSSVTSIGDYAFQNCPLTSVIIPNSVTTIGNGTFALCTSLTNVTISINVISIGSYAFSYCTSLTVIIFSEPVMPTVGVNWTAGIANIRGHAPATSNFPAPGGDLSGLTMGAVISIPDAPIGFETSPGNAQVTLNWTAPTINGWSNIIGYRRLENWSR